MKKIIFLLAIVLGLLHVACDPMEDIKEEIEDIQDMQDERDRFYSELEAAPEAYTLTDEDYELSSNDDVANYKNFSANALPKDFLPEILIQKFYGENAQAMMITYDYYERPTVDEDGAREISEDEYAEMGNNYGSFSDEDEAEYLIGKLLDRKEYADESGVEMTVSYILYSTGETRYVKVNADFSTELLDYASDAIEVTEDQYESLGNGRYNNFDDIDQAQERLALLAETEGTAPITYSCVVYRNYINTYVVYMYNGSNWIVKQSVMAVSEELNFALDEDNIRNSYWWADPAIKITLGTEDYNLFDETSYYQNFDLRSGNTPGTDRSLLVEMVGEMLDTNYSAVEDQQYLVTYAYYDGSNGSTTIRVIKTGGVWAEYSDEE
ncbi:hypothetical protein [Carboxylicivirga linearis]|uniref:Uncharacterized protein n=1 Tax=Carboxylicivirga linearis TaxID=1628157 RepID=A0ABS5JRL7_9BACT|nr:hypothetical protein [Carboxylicivirga linearis]MBS2097529.1 hypothetical protein [Carboxylicivirga linearis]